MRAKVCNKLKKIKSMLRTELRTELMSSLVPFMDDEKAMEQIIVFIHSIQSENAASHSGVERMSHADIDSRLQSVEEDILSGNVMAAEDVHRSIAEKCAWL